MKKKMKRFTRMMAVVGLLAALSAQAATITWQANDITDNVGNISTNGTLVVAKNGAVSSVTVNGVTFASTNTVGNLFDSFFRSDNIGAARGGGSAVSNTSYRTFLSTGQRSGTASSIPPEIPCTQVWTTINLTNLTVGATYEIQIWASDVDSVTNSCRTKGLVLGNGSAGAPVYGTDVILYFESADAPAGTYGTAGQYGIGTFTADATTQNINVRQYTNLKVTPTAGTTAHFSNGWQLRQVPSGIPTVPGSLIYGK